MNDNGGSCRPRAVRSGMMFAQQSVMKMSRAFRSAGHPSGQGEGRSANSRFSVCTAPPECSVLAQS
jgi:hypothetical protein